jgi:hypothetical protein
MPQMTEASQVLIGIVAEPGDDDLQLAEVAQLLRAKLLELDVLDVQPASPAQTPDGAKGIGALLAWLVVKLGGGALLPEVLTAGADWAAHTGRSVEVVLDGDVLKLGRATRQQQQQAFDAWLVRHSADS